MFRSFCIEKPWSLMRLRDRKYIREICNVGSPYKFKRVAVAGPSNDFHFNSIYIRD